MPPPPGQPVSIPDIRLKRVKRGTGPFTHRKTEKKNFIKVFTIVNYKRKGLALPVEKKSEKIMLKKNIEKEKLKKNSTSHFLIFRHVLASFS